MKIHKIKLNQHYVDAIRTGEKTFEVRYNDRGYQKGDKLKFEVVDGELAVKAIQQPFKDKLYTITYVHSGLGMKDNYVVLAIQED